MEEPCSSPMGPDDNEAQEDTPSQNEWGQVNEKHTEGIMPDE